MFLVYKVWNQLYDVRRCNTYEDSALNQKIKLLLLLHFLFISIQNYTDMKTGIAPS